MSLRKSLFRSLVLSIPLLIMQVASANFTVHYKPDGFGGWQSLPGIPAEPLPLSYQEAVNRNFYFIFDSYYPQKQSTGWVGNLFQLSSTMLNMRCRLQIGGYLWQEGQTAKQMYFAPTHHRLDKPVPVGFPPADPFCRQIPAPFVLAFNNGLPLGAPWAGAWLTVATPAMVNAGAFPGVFNNTQITIFGNNCSGAMGNGGQLAYQYNENPFNTRVTLDFNAPVLPPTPMNCFMQGRLYSVWDKDVINDINHTPSAPNPSPLSRGVIDEITNP